MDACPGSPSIPSITLILEQARIAALVLDQTLLEHDCPSTPVQLQPPQFRRGYPTQPQPDFLKMQALPDARQQSFEEIYGPPENFLEIEVRGHNLSPLPAFLKMLMYLL